jgi:uncharacterized protein YbjQ (UPF0145 family)
MKFGFRKINIAKMERYSSNVELSAANPQNETQLGVVSGCFVASRVFYSDFFAGIRNFFGWEIKEYTKMSNEARKKAVERMQLEAESIGATAVFNVRFETNQITPKTTEILVYGTAVRK